VSGADPTIPVAAPRRMVELTVDGRSVRAAEGTTVLQACRDSGCAEIPTLCRGETITPKNACRVCMVEVEGQRTLAPSCSRVVEAGMVVRTDTERVRHSRRMVLELLGSSVDLSITPNVDRWNDEYSVDVERHHPGRSADDRAAAARPVKRDNSLYVRDDDKCILCYQCVDACGSQWQHTFAISVAGRGAGAHIAAEYEAELPDSACVYCGNCIAVCPTGALLPVAEFDLRAAGRWDADRQTIVDTICPYCGVGCQLTLHVQDGSIVKVTSPPDHPVTHGNLCVKGRFGFSYVQNR